MLERKEFGKARNWLIINQSLPLFPPRKMGKLFRVLVLFFILCSAVNIFFVCGVLPSSTVAIRLSNVVSFCCYRHFVLP